MNSFKNILSKIILSLVLIGSISCNDDILDVKPYNQVEESTIFTSPALIEQAVIGMYNAAQRGDYGGAQRGYPFGAAYHQQNDMRGEDMVNTATFYQATYMSSYNGAASLNNVYYWLDTYRLINRANLIINGIEDAVNSKVISAQNSNKFLGEALFFRAISHFELLKHFSKPVHITTNEQYEYGVPYITKGSKNLEDATIEIDSDRKTVSETYVKVLEDLDKAEQLLPSKSNVYRVSKEAAIAYKTIVKLHKRDWAGVITEANKLDGKFIIEPSPNEVFANNAGNKESIFSIENSDTNNPTVNGALASMTKGRMLIAISPVIWNNPAWLATDKRRFEDMDVNTRKPKKEAMVFTTSGRKYTNKYKDDVTRSDAAPIIRYAEVLLNRAEAKARLGDNSYINDLNAVRNRSLADPATQAYTLINFTSKADAVKAILIEKRIEFIGEGKRWGDIHRLINDDLAPTYGIPAKFKNGNPLATDYKIGVPYVFKADDLPAIPYSDRRFLWPIPDVQVNVNSKLKSQQNKGW